MGIAEINNKNIHANKERGIPLIMKSVANKNTPTILRLLEYFYELNNMDEDNKKKELLIYTRWDSMQD